MSTPLTHEEWQAICNAFWAGGAKEWKAEVERIIATRVAKAERMVAEAWEEGFDRGDMNARYRTGRLNPYDKPTQMFDTTSGEAS